MHSDEPPSNPLSPDEQPVEARRGVLPIKHCRIAAFAVISLAIFGCAVLCLLAVWDFAARDTAWRAFASLGIIAAAMIAFVAVNEVFGRALGPNKPLRDSVT